MTALACSEEQLVEQPAIGLFAVLAVRTGCGRHHILGDFRLTGLDALRWRWCRVLEAGARR
jgi:hypothetical protein